MLEVMLWSNYMSDHNMIFIDDIVGYVSDEWWYKNGRRYMEDEGFRKEISDLINKKVKTDEVVSK